VTRPSVVTNSHDGSPYKVWLDYRRGQERNAPAACGRQYWLKEDRNHPNYGIPFVYLVDGRGVCVAPYLYRETTNGRLQAVRSAPECRVVSGQTGNNPTSTPSTPPSTSPVTSSPPSSGIAQEMLAAHNQWRSQVGVPPLQWSNQLANYAQEWADRLAAQNTFEHRQNNRYGENLFWGSGRRWSPTEVVGNWGSESRYFIPGRAFPNLSSTGNWQDVGHYTQIIWRNTTEVGCGVARSGNREVWVCNYNPPGNYSGQRPY
jgi:uncharacterized protein YkwD